MAMTRMEGKMIEKSSAQHDTVQTSEKGRSSIVEIYSQGYFVRDNDDDEEREEEEEEEKERKGEEKMEGE